jgi:SAM-dependent methyltransferase
MKKNWDSSESWYSSCVGEKGHYYHQTVVLPGALRLLNLKAKMSLLDLGCGQGVLARSLPKGVEYWGVDNSKALLAEAKRMTEGNFIAADVTEEIPVEKKDFDAACFILSLQNMENLGGAIQTAATHLKKKGKLLIVLNHPCFRIPRQSGWGEDTAAKLQYRRVNSYLSPMQIPIQTNPGKGEQSAITFSYHHPISEYVKTLAKNHFVLVEMEEWCSDRKSEGGKARMEDRARKEIPLFMALLAEKK